MEFSLSGNALKTLNRSITCLARIGNELIIEASPSQLVFHTLNSSRSAYQAITLKADLFDTFKISAMQAQCSVLLKAVCSILRTPPTSMDRLCVLLPDPEAAKIQWTIDCFNGIRKAYSISCNVQPDIQHLSLDRTKFTSSLVVRPRDFNRLLANFQPSLQEITIIATEPTPLASDAIGGKAVELRSYIDPTKDMDSALHTQLWIDPAEEFLQYSHTGDAVDVTFGVKELKAFVSFCEGCEVDVHLFFEKAGEPILLAPKFGFDDGSNSDFDVTLVLATMLTSQLQDRNTPQQTPAHGMGSQAHHRAHTSTQERRRSAIPTPVSEPASDHTRIWSELSGSAAKGFGGAEEGQVHLDRCADASGENALQKHNRMFPSKPPPERVNSPLLQASRKSLTDPISLENIDLTDDWVVEAEDDDAPLLDVDEIDDWMDVADAILDEGEGGAAADEWWRNFGIDDLELQTLAIRILSQTCSSSGCERNWSVFERIHTKRRNRLEHKRLNDLVYTHYNLRLKESSPQAMETVDLQEIQDRTENDINGWSQRHPGNWVSTGDDDEEDEGEFYVQSTP